MDTRKLQISKDEINALKMGAWKGAIKIIDTHSQMLTALAHLKNESVFGFDTETRPAFQKGVSYQPALIQVAAEKCVYLFRICTLNNIDPLVDFFEDETALKCGVGILNDVNELRDLQNFNPNGFVEISTISRKLGYKQSGLRNLGAILMGIRISKASQLSNWERYRLDFKQVQYAATDAWLSREIYLKLSAQLEESAQE